jgi:hypothetical protein
MTSYPRLSKPSYIDGDKTQIWYSNGELHRTDGPAIMGDEGNFWIINGINITVSVEYWMAVREISWPWDEETQVEFLLSWT